MSQRIKGAFLSYAQIGVKLCIALLFTPILVSSLGQDGYGLLSIVGAMGAYLYILDFGVNDSVLRFFVDHENEPKQRNDFLARMLSFYAFLGVLVLATAALLTELAEPLFSATLSPDQIYLLREMVLVTALGAAVLIAFNPVTALLSATEQFVFLRALEIVASLLSVIVMVLLLNMGYGALMVVAVMAGSMVVQVVLRLLYALLYLHIPIYYRRPAAPELHRVMGYAAPIFLSMIVETIFWKFDNIIIGSYLGTASVAVYAIGIMFNKYFMSFATAISRIMTPDIIRRVSAGADAIELTGMMVRISRIQAVALLLILAGLIVFGQRFITLWLGPDYAVSYFVMLAVICPYALELTGNARNIVLQVKGLYWHKSTITGVMAAINIPLTIWLLHVWGVIGAALSTGLAILIGYGMIALLLQKRVGLSMCRYWLETGRGILPVACVLVVAGLWVEPHLPLGWTGLVFGAVLFTVVYAVAMGVLAANTYERALVRRVLVRLGVAREIAV